MKAYLIISGLIFALIAIAHVLRAFAEPHLIRTNPGEFAFMAALGLLAAFLAVWAFRLLKRQGRA